MNTDILRTLLKILSDDPQDISRRLFSLVLILHHPYPIRVGMTVLKLIFYESHLILCPIVFTILVNICTKTIVGFLPFSLINQKFDIMLFSIFPSHKKPPKQTHDYLNLRIYTNKKTYTCQGK